MKSQQLNLIINGCRGINMAFSNAALSSLYDGDDFSITELNQLLKIQKDILEIIVIDSDYQHALESLCHSVEEVVPNAVTSVMLFDETYSFLSVKAAPSISAQAIKQLDGLKPGVNAGSCGSAVFSGKPQYVHDTLTDARWGNLRPFARNFNIFACWSEPVRDRNNKVVGSFAISSFAKRKVNEFQKALLKISAYMVSLVLNKQDEDKRMEQAAYFDQLTNLPNRALFKLRFDQAIACADRNNSDLAICFIDLDKFKLVNDLAGHEEGDKVLQNVAMRMLACIRKEDTLARYGGDEFVLLVEGVQERNEILSIGKKLMNTFDAPIETDKSNYSVSASIGISLYPKDGLEIESLVQSADRAMYGVKSSEEDVVRMDKIQFSN